MFKIMKNKFKKCKVNLLDINENAESLKSFLNPALGEHIITIKLNRPLNSNLSNNKINDPENMKNTQSLAFKKIKNFAQIIDNIDINYSEEEKIKVIQTILKEEISRLENMGAKYYKTDCDYIFFHIEKDCEINNPEKMKIAYDAFHDCGLYLRLILD